MKYTRTLLLAIAAIAAISCGPKKLPYREALEKVRTEFSAIAEDSTLTEEQRYDALSKLILDNYKLYKDDSLGVKLFSKLAVNVWDEETTLAEFDKASDLIRNDSNCIRLADMARRSAETSPGKPYADITGPDAISGEENSISKVLAAGKPVIVDFWASWCRPCRQEISGDLMDIAKNHSDKVAILGIAVWEDSVDDTRQAMESLSICWPVIYKGGKDSSTTNLYGVAGIPTMVAIDTDGTIRYKGNSAKAAAEALGIN